MSENAQTEAELTCDDGMCNSTAFHGFAVWVETEQVGNRIKATPVIRLICDFGHESIKNGLSTWVDPVAGQPTADVTTAMCLSHGDGPREHEGSEKFHPVTPDQLVLVLNNPRAVYLRTTRVEHLPDRGTVAVFMYAGPEI